MSINYNLILKCLSISTIVLIFVFPSKPHVMKSGRLGSSYLHIDLDIEEEDRVLNNTCVRVVTMQLDYPDRNCVLECRYLRIKIFHYGYNEAKGSDTYLFNATAVECFYRDFTNATDLQIAVMKRIYTVANENTDMEIRYRSYTNDQTITRRCIFFEKFYHWVETAWNEANEMKNFSHPIVDFVA